MEERTITIYGVAREANTSMTTISRIVNGSPNVKPVARKKVLEVIDRLDYRPNTIACDLVGRKTTTVGVIIPDVSNMFFVFLARSTDDVATMHKYNIILVSPDGNDREKVNISNNLLVKQVDGVIFMGHHIAGEIRGKFSRSKTPVILVGSIDPDKQVGSVNIDYISATRDVVNKLVKSGSKKIVLIGGALIDSINGQNHLKGYKEALSENDLPHSGGLIFEAQYNFKDGLSSVDRIHNSGVTAVRISDDELATSILNGLLGRDVKVSGKFEIITSNNPLLTEVARPRLTSIIQPLYGLGMISVRLLTKMMSKEEVEERVIILPYGAEEKGSVK